MEDCSSTVEIVVVAAVDNVHVYKFPFKVEDYNILKILPGVIQHILQSYKKILQH